MATLATAALLVSVAPGAAQAAPPTPDIGPVGTTVTGDVPATVTFTSVDAARYFALALGSDGNVYSWGNNGSGQLGIGATGGTHFTPQAVVQGAIPASASLTQLSGGLDHSLAVADDGWVYAWGENSADQLGDGTATSQNAPVAISQGEIPAGVSLVQVAAGGEFSLALGDNGKVYAWGSNADGQLGDGTNTSSASPVEVGPGDIPAGVNITKVAAGSRHAVALGDDGMVYTWGFNSQGQLGIGSTTSVNVPRAVDTTTALSGLTVTDIAAGFFHTLAIGSDGNAYSWGRNNSGQLGNNGVGPRQTRPVAVWAGAIPAGVTIAQIDGGEGYSTTLGSDGNVYSWGFNAGGQLADGTTTRRDVPVAAVAGVIPGATTITQVTAGSGFALTIGSDGASYSWGAGSSGALGIGDTTSHSEPVKVTEGIPVITGALFGSTAGTGLTSDPTNWSATSPSGEVGTVDVTLQYTVYGAARTEVYTDGYTYTATVTFDTQGGSSTPAITFVTGTAIAVPAIAPTRAGYVFQGWFTDAAATNAFDFSTLLNDSVTLYAGWNPLYTVTFDAQGGSATASATVESGDTVPEPATAPTRAGYTFSGWFTDAAATNLFDFSTTIDSQLTLYAGWTKIVPDGSGEDDSGGADSDGTSGDDLASTGAESTVQFAVLGGAGLALALAGIVLSWARRRQRA